MKTIINGEKEYKQLINSVKDFSKTLEVNQSKLFLVMFKNLIYFIRACDQPGLDYINKNNINMDNKRKELKEILKYVME